MTAAVDPQEINMDARYSVAGYGGIAFYLLGYAAEWTEEKWVYCGEGDRDEESSYLYFEPEKVENRQMVRAVMVGDDAVHTVDIDDLTAIGDLDYCAECGQIGCTADARDRSEGS